MQTTQKSSTILHDYKFVNGTFRGYRVSSYSVFIDEPASFDGQAFQKLFLPFAYSYRGKSRGDWPPWAANTVMCRHGDAAAAEKSNSHKNFETALDAVANTSAAGLPETPGVRMAPRTWGVYGVTLTWRVVPRNPRRLSTVNKQLSNVTLGSAISRD